MVLHSPDDDAIVVAILGPVNVTVGNATLAVITDYPFGDILEMRLSAPSPRPLRVRIPSWATASTMQVNDDMPFDVGAFAGQLLTVPLTAGHWESAQAVVVLFNTNPSIRIEHFFNEAATVHRGALAYALHLEENITITRSYGWGEARDLIVTQPTNTTISWNSALVLDPTSPVTSLSFSRVGPVPEVPFSSTVQSNVITGVVRAMPNWGFAPDGSAAPPPMSPVDCSNCGPLAKGIFVPFGSTHLRMTELPWTTDA
jgi:hypothetical protein